MRASLYCFASQVALLTIALTCLPGAAGAQEPTAEQIDAIKSNCRVDYISSCRSVKPGGPEAIQCLKRNASSAACKSAIAAINPPAAAPPAAVAKPDPAPAAPPPAAAMPAAPPPAATATRAEPSTPPTATAAPASPAPSASPRTAKPAAAPAPAKPATAAAPPKPAVAAAPPAPAPTAPQAAVPARPLTIQDIANVQKTCFEDIGLHCKGVRPGEGRIVDCLMANHGALLPVCKQAVLQARR